MAVDGEGIETMGDILAKGFGEPGILDLGELILDGYVWRAVDRISSEAPVREVVT